MKEHLTLPKKKICEKLRLNLPWTEEKMAWHVTLKAPKFIKLKVSPNSQLEGGKKKR